MNQNIPRQELPCPLTNEIRPLLMIVSGMVVCSSFLISVSMFIVSKDLLMIVRAGGAIWLNPFATVLFSVCSAVTVECCVLYLCCMGVFGMFAVM